MFVFYNSYRVGLAIPFIINNVHVGDKIIITINGSPLYTPQGYESTWGNVKVLTNPIRGQVLASAPDVEVTWEGYNEDEKLVLVPL